MFGVWSILGNYKKYPYKHISIPTELYKAVDRIVHGRLNVAGWTSISGFCREAIIEKITRLVGNESWKIYPETLGNIFPKQTKLPIEEDEE